MGLPFAPVAGATLPSGWNMTPDTDSQQSLRSVEDDGTPWSGHIGQCENAGIDTREHLLGQPGEVLLRSAGRDDPIGHHSEAELAPHLFVGNPLAIGDRFPSCVDVTAIFRSRVVWRPSAYRARRHLRPGLRAPRPRLLPGLRIQSKHGANLNDPPSC